MDWMESLKKAIDYIESNLLSDINASDVAKKVMISPFYFQKAFTIMTGYTISEYIRNRRLYLAALELTNDSKSIKENISEKNVLVIDIAYKYLYDTPESFTKAFTRFHGYSPQKVKNNSQLIKVFLPLTFYINIRGGNEMDFEVQKMESFKIIGFKKQFSSDTAYKEIPKFWDEVFTKYVSNYFGKREPVTKVEKAIANNCIGEFGVCLDNIDSDMFTYMVAGKYNGGEVPEEMEVMEIPSLTWAKFSCVGPIPGAIQAVNTKIFKEWLPGNPDYDLSAGYNIEWYSAEDQSSPNYHSAIWLPVRKK